MVGAIHGLLVKSASYVIRVIIHYAQVFGPETNPGEDCLLS